MRALLLVAAALLIVFAGPGCDAEERRDRDSATPLPERAQATPTTETPGRFESSGSPEAPGLSDQDRERLEQLELLGYVNSVPIQDATRGRSGVVLHLRAQAEPGFNFFNARHERSAQLINMAGEVVHRWQSDATGATYQAYQARFPGLMPGYLKGWNHVELLRDGGILAIGTHHSLLRLDRDSKLIWKRDLPAHHDVDVAPDGTIYALIDSIRVVEIDGKPVAFQDSAVAVLSSEGELEGSYSIYDALSGPEWRTLLDASLRRVAQARRGRLRAMGRRAAKGGEGGRALLRLYQEASRGEVLRDAGIKNVLFHNQAEDIIHANSLQRLPAAEPGLWKAGDFLVSILRYDMAVVIDRETGKVVWSFGQRELQQPHHATQLPGGDILIFDNGTQRGYSRVVRVAPKTGEIVWQYRSDPKEAFFSAQRGGAQLLPGGNVLIANTDSGNAFEVTPSGERVWEFFTDELKAGERAALYRMERFSSAEIEARLGPSVSQRISVSTSRSSPPAISAGLAGGMGRRAAVASSD